MIETLDLVLTGGRTGATCVLNNKQFVKGVMRLKGSREQLEPVISYYGRVYHAFPHGSKELETAQVRDAEGRKPNGQHNADKAAQSGSANGVDGTGANANAGQHQAATGTAVQHGADHDAQAGSAGVRSNRDGHGDTGIRAGQESQQQQSDAPGDLTKIRAAVLALDGSNNDNWTQEGKPTVDAVSNAMNDPQVTRKLIDAAAGDWDRDQARAK